jgi:hypothetical protein
LRRIRGCDAHISGVNLAHMSRKCYAQNLRTMFIVVIIVVVVVIINNIIIIIIMRV